MTKKIILLALCSLLLAPCFAVEAQQAVKIPRIGYLSGGSRSAKEFRQGLRELGYVEGKNIIIEWRSAEGTVDRLPALAAELVRLKVDVIVTGGGRATRAAKAATKTIPIVMAQVPDPVGDGFVASLARPGGNITGLSALGPELSGKRLELLKETVPKLSRVAVLGTSTTPGNAQQLREVELAAGALGVKLQFVDVLSPKDIGGHSEVRSRGVLTHSWRRGAGSSMPTEHKLQISRYRAGSRQCTTRQNLWKREGLCSMAWTFPIYTGAPLFTSTRSSKALNLPIFP
jgi:putative ABC transport system substrate-binding protein